MAVVHLFVPLPQEFADDVLDRRKGLLQETSLQRWGQPIGWFLQDLTYPLCSTFPCASQGDYAQRYPPNIAVGVAP